MPETEKPSVLEHIRAKAAHFPGNEYAQVVLAEAAGQLGDRAHAQELLKATLAADPDNRRAMLDLAWWELSAKDLDSKARLEADRRARTWAVKANRLAPNDPEALSLFYVTFAHEAAGPSKNAIDGLTQAYEYLPQYQPTAQLLAHQELHDGKPDMAVSILEPIAYSPHAGPAAQKLRDWIAEIKAKESPAHDSKPWPPGATRP
jgi:tetratricopeptide (TPR) repeat protein